mmetsp:Transcript_12605/g.34821  ORF Transcript_12605/g.34821 Transcript_12605/m.34821 type:complete len:136 (+) Transcript_12605:645-1052(+)
MVCRRASSGRSGGATSLSWDEGRPEHPRRRVGRDRDPPENGTSPAGNGDRGTNTGDVCIGGILTSSDASGFTTSASAAYACNNGSNGVTAVVGATFGGCSDGGDSSTGSGGIVGAGGDARSATAGTGAGGGWASS